MSKEETMCANCGKTTITNQDGDCRYCAENKPEAIIISDAKLARKVLQQYQSDVYEYGSELDKNRLGKVLTIVDSSIADETQRKAVKDLINDAWYNARPRYGKFYQGHPHLADALGALGFDLYTKEDMPSAMPVERINPYESLIKQ